jgi:hypothetical protein
MANTSQIKQDYFKLLNLLNKGNKKSNEKTEVYFYIEQIGSEFLFFAAISLKQRILLVRKNNSLNWHEANISGLIYLEEFLSKTLIANNIDNSAEGLSEQIKSALFKYF